MSHPGPLRPYRGVMPRVAPDAFVADTAIVTGDVEIASGASVWFGVVIRGDSEPVRIGERTNIQDGSILHSDPGLPTTLGNDVTIGHRAIVHGCTVHDRAQISMGAIVLSGAVIGQDAIVGAGALVPEGMIVEPGTLVIGVPARPRRAAREDDLTRTRHAAEHYHALGAEYRAIWDDLTSRT